MLHHEKWPSFSFRQQCRAQQHIRSHLHSHLLQGARVADCQIFCLVSNRVRPSTRISWLLHANAGRTCSHWSLPPMARPSPVPFESFWSVIEPKV